MMQKEKNTIKPKELLSGSLCYLIGSIEYANDQGTNWRTSLRDQCKNSSLKIKFLDPTAKISGLQPEIDAAQDDINALKKKGKWDTLSMYMKPIVREDHRCVDISDFVVFYLDTSCHTCGSYFEFQNALEEKKPYFLIVKGGKKNTPAWLFGIMDHENIYNSVEEVVNTLIKIDNGTKSLSDRWVLIRKQIEEM
jgi:hypothetical protein